MSSPRDLGLDELLREVILDHYRKPRHRGRLDGATHEAEGMNPVCGDEVSVQVRLEEVITEAAFSGAGCSISQASASMMSEAIIGRDAAGVAALAADVRTMLQTGSLAGSGDLGDIEALQGVAQFPVRVKCALLSWNVLELALRLQIPTTTGDTHE